MSRPVEDPPELWSDAQLAEALRRHLARGSHSLKDTRRFGELMDEAVDRERSVCTAGSRDDIWNALLVKCGPVRTKDEQRQLDADIAEFRRTGRIH